MEPKDANGNTVEPFIIDGTTYLPVRAVSNALGLNVGWDDATSTVSLGEGAAAPQTQTRTASPVSLSLKYSGGGHTDDNLGLWYIEEPASTASAVGDVDGDGKPEIIFAVRDVFCLDAATGKIKWMTPYGHDVSETGLTDSNAVGICVPYVPSQIVDLDNDGKNEVVTYCYNPDSNKGFIGVYDGTGHFKFPLIELPYAVRAAKIADLDGDGKKETAVLLGVGEAYRYSGAPALYVYNNDGSLRAGFPQKLGYGAYSNSMEAVDLDGDGKLELVMLSDQAYVAAFRNDGTKVVIKDGPFAGKTWDSFIDYEDYEFTQRLANGLESTYRADRGGRYSIMGTRSGVIATDVDGDGVKELVCTTMINDQKVNDDIMGAGEMTPEDMMNGIAKYFTAFILNLNHSRYANEAKGYDWTAWPKDVGTILTFDNFSVISNPDTAPVVADLDGDGSKEILFSSYDGTLHCFNLDGTEHGSWPFNANAGGGALTMTSKPAAADINGDGLLEVVFTTYTAKNQMEKRGRLYVTDYSGKVLYSEELPQAWGMGGGDVNVGYPTGSQAEPVIADVDGDGRAEIIITTLSCGVCVYKTA